MGDPLEALNTHCGTCGGVSEVSWCLAWIAWLCARCRAVRNDNELRIPLTAKSVMQAEEAGDA